MNFLSQIPFYNYLLNFVFNRSLKLFLCSYFN